MRSAYDVVSEDRSILRMMSVSLGPTMNDADIGEHRTSRPASNSLMSGKLEFSCQYTWCLEGSYIRKPGSQNNVAVFPAHCETSWENIGPRFEFGSIRHICQITVVW